MLTRWQLAGLLVIAAGMGLMLGLRMPFKSPNAVPSTATFVTGMVIASIGGFIIWKTTNARKPPADDSQNSD